jgi:hypothetical protein
MEFILCAHAVLGLGNISDNNDFEKISVFMELIFFLVGRRQTISNKIADKEMNKIDDTKKIISSVGK